MIVSAAVKVVLDDYCGTTVCIPVHRHKDGIAICEMLLGYKPYCLAEGKKGFKFNQSIAIERYKLFDSYDDLYEIAVVESMNPRARYRSDFEESIANGWIYG